VRGTEPERASTVLSVEVVFGIALVLLGALLAYGIQALGKRQDITLQARLILTDTFRFLFADGELSLLNAQLHRVRIYLELANVPEDLIQRFEDKAKECWRDSTANAEEHFDPQVGHVMSSSLLDEYRALEAQVNASLSKRWVSRTA
jgi:hypothetical protein